jgi:hypothetical protein
MPAPKHNQSEAKKLPNRGHAEEGKSVPNHHHSEEAKSKKQGLLRQVQRRPS